MDTFLDENLTRYQLASSSEGTDINWLFLPGGPGCDSSIFNDLINSLKLPGKCWLIDFPGNGTNNKHVSDEYDFNQWDDCLATAVARFENPVLIGHSFGGMFPLLFPELEKSLKGLVILSSAPKLWHEATYKMGMEMNKPNLEIPMDAFVNNPNNETFKTALLACAPYYFADEFLEVGKKFLEKLDCNYKAAVWWQKKAIEIQFDAKWIPQAVPTLIICGSQDCVCPSTLFENDTRFQRPNITLKTIQDAGHIVWLEKPEIVQNCFKDFLKLIQ
ncbi:MAG: alpha/beta hydrolase [Parachlamydiales bacterium]|nr:alpha/beta hydrolase [Parachlamydiales bacterium]